MTVPRDIDLRQPGFIALALVNLVLQTVGLRDALLRADHVQTILSGLGLLISFVLGFLIISRKISPRLVFRVILWAVCIWYSLFIVEAVMRPDAVSWGLYMTQLVLVAVACLLLPMRRAALLSSASGVAMMLVSLTRANVDVSLLAMVAFIGALIGFLSFHGQGVRETLSPYSGEGSREAQTGLLKRQAALFALRDSVQHRPAALSGMTVLLITVDSIAPLSELLGGSAVSALMQRCAGRLRAELRPNEFAGLWDNHTFLVTLQTEAGEAGLARAEELRRIVAQTAADMGPALVRAGAAVLERGQTLEEGLAVANARLFYAKAQAGASTVSSTVSSDELQGQLHGA